MVQKMERILVVDDDIAVTNYLNILLMQADKYEPRIVNDSVAVPGILAAETFDAILLDMDMPGLSGLDILQEINEKEIRTPVVILSGVNDADLAVSALKLGAFDYLTKPVEDEKLLEVIDAATRHKTQDLTIRQLPPVLKREDLTFREAFEHVPTQDPGMIRLFHLAEKMAAGDLSIFLIGERGAGKASLARAIHKASPRRDKPFVAVDASEWPPEELSAMLFGQAKDWSGAREETRGFIEEADGGTMFINNIATLTIPVQVRLLRVIQKKEFYRDDSTKIRKINVRIIASSDVDLPSDEYRDTFSRDLLYHLMVNSLHMPPLHQRPDDIPLLANHFLKEETKKTGKEISGFSPDFLDLLKGHYFPNNLDELQAIIASAVINTDGDTITVESLTPYMREFLKTGLKPE